MEKVIQFSRDVIVLRHEDSKYIGKIGKARFNTSFNRIRFPFIVSFADLPDEFFMEKEIENL